jgi:hypothetical protein
MPKRTHRTARGQSIDMEALRLSNEETIAVGNMKVNARGDELGFGGKVVRTRKEIMDETYKVHTMVPQEDRVYKDAEESAVASSKPTSTGVETKQPEPKAPTVEEQIAKIQEPKPEPKEEPQVMRGGLAAALAKKVEMSEPEVKPTGLNDGSGVKRI